MPKIFISYSSKSKERVAPLAQDVAELPGWDVWFDRKLTGGQEWWDAILQSIRDADVFLLALTAEALDSQACRRELVYAQALGKTVLPVIVGDISINLLPSAIKTIQAVDYRQQDKQAAFRLMNALNALPPSPPLPRPLPSPPEVPISYMDDLKDHVDATALSPDEQASLVLKLKERLSDAGERDDAVLLLERLRQRPDLLARIASEIDAALASVASGAKLNASATFSDWLTGGMKRATEGISTARSVRMEAPPSPAPAEKPGWSTGTVLALWVGTVFLPPVGIVAGLVGWNHPVNRKQAIALSIVGILLMLSYVGQSTVYQVPPYYLYR